jgi:hypothetical protein
MIVANLDEGLPLKQQAILNAHLQECPKCRQLNEQTAVLLATLREDVPDNPGEEFWTRFETTLQARLQEQDRRTGWLFPWGKVGIVAAAVLLLAIGLRTLMPRSPEYATLPTSANIVMQELYMVYGPLSEDFVTVEYDRGESEYDRNIQYLTENGALQPLDDDDDDDDPVPLFL